MKIRKTKEQQLLDEWKAYNKRMKASRLPIITLEEYQKVLYGRVRLKPQKATLVATGEIPSWATDHRNIPSLISNKRISLSRDTMVERVIQGKITGEEADGILDKADRIVPLTSKGAYGLLTAGTDPKTLGKKTQELE
jgi:hypothetical protein